MATVQSLLSIFQIWFKFLRRTLKAIDMETACARHRTYKKTQSILICAQTYTHTITYSQRYIDGWNFAHDHALVFLFTHSRSAFTHTQTNQITKSHLGNSGLHSQDFYRRQRVYVRLVVKRDRGQVATIQWPLFSNRSLKSIDM